MTVDGMERTILKTRPDTRGILLQFRYLFHAALAVASLHPTVQTFVDDVAYGILHLDTAYLPWTRYGIAGLLVLKMVYMFLYQKTCEFVLTDDRLIIRYGIMLRVEDEIELYRVVDVTQTVGLLQRLFNVGSVYVASTDRTGNIVMPLIPAPSNVRNAVRTEAERCKSRRGTIRVLE